MPEEKYISLLQLEDGIAARNKWRENPGIQKALGFSNFSFRRKNGNSTS